MYNINRIKGNSTKLELLVEQASRERVDIIGINETNIKEQQGKFMLKKESNYISFQILAEEGKNKDSGVGLIIYKLQEKHIGRITKCSNY